MQDEDKTGSDEPRSTTTELREAVAAFTRTLGQTLSEAGSEARREVVQELNQASRELSQDLDRAASGLARGTTKRQERAQRTRVDLLDAARDLFVARGYEGASVADIAAAAGYTKGALYSNFGSKEELFLAVIRHAQDDATASGEDRRVPNLLPGEHDLPDVILSLEAYLYALRRPEARDELVELGTRQLEALAAFVHQERTSGTAGGDDAGAPTRHDRDTAVALAALHTLGGILAMIMPPEADVPGAVERVAERLFE